MLMQLTAKDRANQMKKYGEKAVCPFFVGWILFYQDPSSQSRCIILDNFRPTRILISGVTQFEKMITQFRKSISVDYLNNDWYADIYHCYTNQGSPLSINHTQ